jgi:hypothetical protein
MKPLASPVAEFRTMAVAQLLGAAAMVVGAVAAEAPAYDLVRLPVEGAIFGGLMYVLVYRRFTRQAVDHAGPAPIDDREPPFRVRLRVGALTAGVVAFMALIGVATESFALFAGVVAGNGAALLLVARLIRRWEDEHRRRLLREPRSRWRWRMRGGSGFFDPEDFYVEVPRAT